MTETASPLAAASPSSIGSAKVKVAVGNWPVSRARCTLSSRRDSLVVMVLTSISKLASVTVVPSMTIEPVTSPVRPTAVVDPIDASSSSMRKPAKVPGPKATRDRSPKATRAPGALR